MLLHSLLSMPPSLDLNQSVGRILQGLFCINMCYIIQTDKALSRILNASRLVKNIKIQFFQTIITLHYSLWVTYVNNSYYATWMMDPYGLSLYKEASKDVFKLNEVCNQTMAKSCFTYFKPWISNRCETKFWIAKKNYRENIKMDKLFLYAWHCNIASAKQ